MSTVAVYTVMRDEAANVAQWAETTGEADYRYVLDTGSTDGTLGELERHGIDYDCAWIEPFRFDDARNAALARIPPDVDWCLQLDADETLSWDWRTRFRMVEDARVGRYRYRWEDDLGARAGVVYKTNLHARHGFRWRYPCHEILVPNDGPVGDVPLMIVNHHPDFSKSRAQYLDLLDRGVVEDPSDHRMAFYFGRELYYQGRWQRARGELWRFLNLPNGWHAERAEAWRILASIDDDPERWLWRAVGECPQRREPYCDLARLYHGRGDDDQARAMVLLASRRDDESIYTTSRDCWGEAFEMLAVEVDAT